MGCLVTQFLHVLFNLVEKHFPVFFWLVSLHFVSEKNEDKVSRSVQLTQRGGTRGMAIRHCA